MKNKSFSDVLWNAILAISIFNGGIVAHDAYLRYYVPRVVPFRTHCTTDAEDAVIREVTAKMHPPIVRSAQMVVRVRDVWDGIRARHVQDVLINGIILIGDMPNGGLEKNRPLFARTVRHEFTHAFAAHLPKRAWEELAVIKPLTSYVGEDWKILQPENFPREGFVQPYACKNPDEYVGALGEEVFTFLAGEPSAFDRFDNDHPCWRRLFNWLLKWDVISEEDHARLTALLDS